MFNILFILNCIEYILKYFDKILTYETLTYETLTYETLTYENKDVKKFNQYYEYYRYYRYTYLLKNIDKINNKNKYLKLEIDKISVENLEDYSNLDEYDPITF
jgi:hypothetical protein